MKVRHLVTGAVLSGALLLSACGEAATPTVIVTPAPTNTAEVLSPTELAPTPATTPAATDTAAIPTATAAAAAPSPTSPVGPLTKTRLALDWTPNTNHTGFYVAQQKGWYREQGIDLQILPYSDAASPDALVAAGQADFASSFVEQVVIDRVSDLPIKSVAAIVQHNTSELA